ncbi:MAG TPA: asparagine synthase (glutamine-hydrolyzing) [Thermoleophilaceae bacterium]|nr:asparagine synthase (glutamine-hydrolyzing) [Thermoleophilaceae bacterium]
MCGIVGQARGDGSEVAPALIGQMCQALEHRGPDSRGVHTDAGVGLGIQRLRIIDLATGDQPIFSEDGQVVVVLNGEIYNYRELRRRLEQSGHVFSTRSDTEVIVHLYEELGADCVDQLHGMFGLAIWDVRRRRLLLARDRLGKKPLYYCEREGTLSFASELPALVRDPGVPRDIDHQALDAYLAFRWVPGPRTAYRHVRKLEPATTLVFEDGRVSTRRYWRLTYNPKQPALAPGELHEQIRERIRAATRKRLVSDVPLGAFLSGGVDSAAVVAAMAEASTGPVRTFSVGFGVEEYDELPLARLVAERFGTEHHELTVQPDAMEIIPRIVRHHGEPFADASSIPSFYVAEMARRHVTVALNGDGGDESFAGYPRYVAQALLARAARLPGPARRGLRSLSERLPASGRINSWPSRARRFGHALPLDGAGRYLAYATELNGLDRARLYTPEHRERIGPSIVEQVVRGPWEASTGTDVVDVMLDVDVQTYLVDDLLTKMDIASMAASLEARSPLLDHEWMEFCATLPPSAKLHRGQKKAALRAALRGWVPDEVLDAPKRGFKVPMAEWFRGDLRAFAREILLDRDALDRGWFDERYVRGLLDRHADSVQDHSQGIWTLLNFELWHREFGPSGG